MAEKKGQFLCEKSVRIDPIPGRRWGQVGRTEHWAFKRKARVNKFWRKNYWLFAETWSSEVSVFVPRDLGELTASASVFQTRRQGPGEGWGSEPKGSGSPKEEEGDRWSDQQRKKQRPVEKLQD